MHPQGPAGHLKPGVEPERWCVLVVDQPSVQEVRVQAGYCLRGGIHTDRGQADVGVAADRGAVDQRGHPDDGSTTAT